MSLSQAVSVIYEDDNIRVVHKLGNSQFILITFSDLISAARESSFFAETPARKADLACIGFMAKSGNWYPSRSMTPAIQAISYITGRYEKKITYGGSMGGYAAVKYTSALQATHAISLCPQWSIDKEECGGINPGWQGHYSSSLKGMGIKINDISGKIFVLSDMFDKIDSFHARKIVELSDNIELINVPRVGHHVTSMVAGTNNLIRLIDACLAEDVKEIGAICSSSRRKFKYRIAQIRDFAKSRFPLALDEKICLAYESGDSEFIATNSEVVYRALTHCVKNRVPQRALSIARRYAAYSKDFTKHWKSINFLAHISNRPYVIKTFHNSILCYSHEDGDICAVRFPSMTVTPIRISLNGPRAFLYVSLCDCTIYFFVSGGRFVSTIDIEKRAGIDIRHEDGFMFSLAVGGKFVCVDPRSGVSVNRDKVDSWEKFYFDFPEETF